MNNQHNIKEEQTQNIDIAQLQDLLQITAVLSPKQCGIDKKQTNRSMEPNKEPRIGPHT